jgi:acetolactate synthase I/II/III large subunit
MDKVKVKVSDEIAKFLKNKEIKHIFGIIGSANSHIFDSINQLGYTKIVCVHHEQAATMAIQAYYRVTGKISAAIVTAGGGSANAITGVISAWADSIPGIIISGQENLRFIQSMENMRMWGIQGFDISLMVDKITKYSTLVKNPNHAIYELEKAYYIASDQRPGPVWIDYPMDIQGKNISLSDITHFSPPKKLIKSPSSLDIKKVLNMIGHAKRPIFWLGHGVRLSDSVHKIGPLLDKYKFPTLVSWAGIDMLEDDHLLNYGRAGVYGNRSANFVLQNSDLVIAIGNRMAIPMIGYEHDELARDAKIIQVDIDEDELLKTKNIAELSIVSDAGVFIDKIIDEYENLSNDSNQWSEWVSTCNGFKERYPYIGPEHKDKNNFINSYNFINELSNYFKEDQIITTDMGTALLSGHQVIRLNKDQRLFTSTGLGEMGYGLPAAIGASFASDSGEVLSLNCDGGMMMNLQELQTIVHHNLPIKIFVFNNDGYLMIKHTQKNLFKGEYVGTDRKSGVSCPDYSRIADAFKIKHYSIKSWEDFENFIPQVQDYNGPVICDVFMDPEQFFYPKLSLVIKKDGSIVSPPLEDLSPLLSREVINKEMLIGLHKKSKKL